MRNARVVTGMHGSARLPRARSNLRGLSTRILRGKLRPMSSLLAILATIGAAAPQPAELRQPTGKWVIDYHDSQCIATRPFGTDEEPLFLAIKPSPTSTVVQLALVEKGSNRPGVQSKATISFDSGPQVNARQLEFGIEKKNIQLVNLTEQDAAGLGGSRTIVWAARGAPMKLATGPMADVMKVLANCRDDLRNHWNITDAKKASLLSQARVEKPLITLFSSDDYPAQAISQEDSGTTSIVLMIDEKGAIQDCMVDGTSGIPTLDAMSCIILRKRAKFEPAIGADGKPARSSYMQRIRWMMADGRRLGPSTGP